MSTEKPSVYLADLTHTGQVVASNVAPLGIGIIASYLKSRDADVDVELFKYPNDLNAALERALPDIIGFANYSWNCELAYKFAQRIREVSPKTVIVFGGPNYGLTDAEIQAFWADHPLIDFYVVKEGEIAFYELVQALRANRFDCAAVQNGPTPPANCHFRRGGQIITGDLLPRIQNLDELGSPYLLGLMDKFFDGVLIPMIHTTRGCPFTCTFCTEGNAYYSKVSQRNDLQSELTYIAEHRGSVQDLVITDANFGMYKEDRAKAKTIAEVQDRYGWPKRILVSTGKNQKERIIEVASTLKGAISIAASLQSTDDGVLTNIKRANISSGALRAIVEQSTAADTPTYTEIILGLPGDTVEIHTKSLSDVVSAGLGIVRMYQLILLPQTELNTPETRSQFSMKTKFRINPRSFGRYEVLGKQVVAIETEEILTSSNTLSESDYFSCRELDLTVEILHNTGMFSEVAGLCAFVGHPWFDLIRAFFERRRTLSPAITALYDTFTGDSQKRLWASRAELEAHVEANIDAYLNDPWGTNEMAVSKAIAFFQLQEELHNVVFSLMGDVFKARARVGETTQLYLDELKRFSLLRKRDFIELDQPKTEVFHFDFEEIRKRHFAVDPSEWRVPDGTELQFHHTDEQRQMINGYVNQYGKTLDGLGRILMRAPVKTLFRDIAPTKNRAGGLAMESFG